MNKPMLQNDDRGITLNKSLAWTIMVGLFLGGLYAGTELADVKSGVEELAGRQEEDRVGIRMNQAAISELKTNGARVDQRLTGIEMSTSRTENKVDEIWQFLREQQGGRP